MFFQIGMLCLVMVGGSHAHGKRETIGACDLLAAIRGEKIGLVKQMIEKKCDLTVQDELTGQGPLHVATILHNLELQKILLAAGVAPDGKDKKGRTALHWAAMGLDMPLVNNLLAAGAGINARDGRGQTALHLAASLGPDLVEDLLDSRADMTVKNSRGMTPLHMAVVAGKIKVVEILLARGANPRAQDAAGMSPRSYAKLYNHPEIETLIAQAENKPSLGRKEKP